MKLCFAIPNYNKGTELLELLDSINKACEDASLDYSIVVSDNASTDGSAALLKNLQGDLAARLTIVEQQQNIGFQGNLLRVLEDSTGDYTWLMGSDDALSISGFRHVLKKLKEIKPDITVTNRIKCDVHLNEKENDAYVNTNNEDWLLVENLATYLQDAKTVDALGCFISSLVFSEASRLALVAEAYSCKLFDTNIFPHVFPLWSLLISERHQFTLHYCPVPAVKWRAENSSFASGQVFKCSDLLLIASALSTESQIKNEFASLVVRHYQNCLSLQNALRESKPLNSEQLSALSVFCPRRMQRIYFHPFAYHLLRTMHSTFVKLKHSWLF